MTAAVHYWTATAREAPLAPSMWFAANTLAYAHGDNVLEWTDSVTGLKAVGKDIPTGVFPKMFHKMPLWPHVRLGINSADGGYFDLGSRTWHVTTGGSPPGLTVIACVSVHGFASYARLLNFSNNRNEGHYFGQDDSNGCWWFEWPGYGTVSTGIKMAPRTWVVVVFRYSQAGISVFVNNAVFTKTGSGSVDPDTTLANNYIGYNCWGNSAANIDVRELLLYERALSDAQVSAEIAKLRTWYHIW